MVVTRFCPTLTDKVEVTMLVNHGQVHRHINLSPPDLLLPIPNPLPHHMAYLMPTEIDDRRPPTPPRSWVASTPNSKSQPRIMFQGTLSGHRDSQSLDSQSLDRNVLEQSAQTRKRVREIPECDIDLIPGSG
jgi:hypothetical protein